MVLLCQHDDDGALGLVINRDGPVTISDVLERMDMATEPAPDQPTWWGGPVASGAGFVLWRGQAELAEGWTLSKDVAVSPSAERLAELVDSGQRFHLVLGYAGWGPGQLEEEVEQGAWLFAELDSTILFDTPVDARYDYALALLGLSLQSLIMSPISE